MCNCLVSLSECVVWGSLSLSQITYSCRFSGTLGLYFYSTFITVVYWILWEPFFFFFYNFMWRSVNETVLVSVWRLCLLQMSQKWMRKGQLFGVAVTFYLIDFGRHIIALFPSHAERKTAGHFSWVSTFLRHSYTKEMVCHAIFFHFNRRHSLAPFMPVRLHPLTIRGWHQQLFLVSHYFTQFYAHSTLFCYSPTLIVAQWSAKN